MSRKEKPKDRFNAPFRELDKRLHAGRSSRREKPAPASKASARAFSESTLASRGISGPDDEATIFVRAMDGVKPLGGHRRRRLPAKPVITAPGRVREGEDEEATAILAGLVSGKIPFDITETGEYVEGCVSDFDRRNLRKLRAGEISVRDDLDLHGMTSEEARGALDRFIQGAVGQRISCVRVVHGRGLHSREAGPVLKEKVVKWLSGRRLGRMVLAFTSARPVDGGTGALYVLLRKRPRP